MARKPPRRFRNIILMGMPGSGKTTFGKILAHHTRREFIDFDRYIKNTTGRTIPQIFAKEGEEGFRALESRLLRKLERRSNLVIAMGGGTLCNEENLEFAHQLGFLIFLTAPLETIAERIFQEKGTRPLFESCTSVEETLERVKALWGERQNLYERADVILDTALSSFDNLKFQVTAMEKKYFHPGHQADLQRIQQFSRRHLQRIDEAEEEVTSAEAVQEIDGQMEDENSHAHYHSDEDSE